MEDKELYQEENIQLTKQIRDSLKDSIIIPRSPTIKSVKATITNKVMAELTGKVDINESSLTPLSDEITTKLDGVAELIAKAIREAKPELVKEIRVLNLEDARSETVKVNNLEKLEQLIQKLTDTVIEKQPIVNVQKEVTKFPNTSRDYVSVRLTNGKEFYEALLQAASGGGPSVVGLKANGADVSDSNPLPVSATVEVGDVQIGAVEIKNSTDDTRATVGDNGLYVDVRSSVLPSTSAVTSVSDTASSTTLLSANASRRAGFIVNDSSAPLYLKYGTTASTTSYTDILYQYERHTITTTGRIDGIWGSDPNDGAARITEIT